MQKPTQRYYVLRTAFVATVFVGCFAVVLLLIRNCAKKQAALQNGGDPSVTNAPIATATPAPIITFAQDAENPLPTIDDRLAFGAAYEMHGTVHANRPITSITVRISCAYNNDPFYPYTKTVYFRPINDIRDYSLTDISPYTEQSLASLVDFSALQVGIHTLTVSVTCAGQSRGEKVFTTKFYVLSDDWHWIKVSDFNESYDAALSFFEDAKRFCYRYQWVRGRYTVADPEWENTYITKIEGLPVGSLWRVHIDAVPYYEQAFQYLDTSYVRVHGTNGDSGILQLSDLVIEYNGSYVSRFTSSLKTISHHAFGAATDINASMQPNKNLAENNQVLHDDVANFLVYNGIECENGQYYYDYTYSGSYAILHDNIPETCINYLLYELAFYRAGFLWGHYYISTSDGMHFTLSDYVKGTHEDAKGLRKVYEYYN